MKIHSLAGSLPMTFYEVVSSSLGSPFLIFHPSYMEDFFMKCPVAYEEWELTDDGAVCSDQTIILHEKSWQMVDRVQGRVPAMTWKLPSLHAIGTSLALGPRDRAVGRPTNNFVVKTSQPWTFFILDFSIRVINVCSRRLTQLQNHKTNIDYQQWPIVNSRFNAQYMQPQQQ
ncbi:hypothetical protein Nepgr_001840 [Nepenthes gracilis]|uniref:Uncharacterized protein n=1 Tax=Nepenthes gracilis TaxID=150966 RepID=A0AAD3P5R1_NEPGR|nr:hypothetical protein Nepgr_001840 [Nepenthes gracilis]